ncbi:SusC/RagA family TonB-linked outer membrane protein [Flavisolibacter ginsengisoli]|jgi:TonB-linked SusC/RagA family outer membrane protein|uniref:TonB-linked outer membrane protein, SusC/RagA family n=1 Tax=Flavisolibacter ginsengisoli DSM 18119 TaxID=1121884 RepID=A0A1M4WSD4_9BACT|nr:SusC/RagA family TonB-linked outer membrane protein [Flavisolibacter ginsengisoli]SHE84146.1 TonB-linked outer membrane protein, SusC/RagA family [Flavisolibacter ginsengisoli DSM 18119]
MRSFATAVEKLCTPRVLLFFFLLLTGSWVSAQEKTVTGQVRNSEDKAPVVRATVQVKGTKVFTSTDEKGHFSIKASDQQVLVVSAVGYRPLEKRVGNQSVLNFDMISTNTEMESVVVTALGIKREEKALGYSVAKVKGEELTEALSSNWTDALSGKVAGLNLVRSNSGPAGSNKIILRGESNLTGGSENEALIVVDGVVINQGSGRRSAVGGETAYGTGSDNMPADYGSGLNDINPEDIESVSVLKGPGAAALYGQRGANGAIIITTKSGSAKRKGWGVTLNSNASMEKVNRWPDFQYEYGQGNDGKPYYSFGASVDGPSTSATSSAYGPRFEGQSFFQFDPVTQTQGTERTPWVPYPNKIKNYFNTGNTVTNSISVDGGTDKTTARFSVTNVSNKWIIPNTGYKRNTIALSVNSKVNEKLQISSKINYTNKWSDNLPGAGYGNQSIMYWFIFWQPNADLDWLRNYWRNGLEGRKIMYPYSSFPENPYAVAYEFINRSNRHNITGNVQASYNFSKELSLQVRTSLDLSYEQRAQERPFDAGSKYQLGSFRTQNIFSQEATTDFLLRYAKKLKDFDFSVTAGGSALRNTYNKDEVRADSLIYPQIYSMSNAAGPLVTLPYNTKYAINSFYGLVSGAFKNFLFLDLTARQDWNSVLATPTRTENAGFFYPSANLSFIASEVLKLPSSIDFAKLRFSASGVGSGGTTPYRTAYNYTSAGSLYSGGLQNPSILANPDLKSLRTVSYETGMEIKMFHNRLNMDLALYTGNTKDQILERILDRSSGYTKVLINAGKVNNKGVEVSLNGTPISSKKGLKWNTGIVFSANSNTIKELADSSVVLQTGPVGGGQIVAKVGGSMGDLYGRGYERAPDGQVVYDANTGFAKITQDVIFLGNTIPKWKLGFNNEFQYKGFRLNLLFDGQYGAVAHSLMHYKLAEQGKTKNTLPGRYNGIIGNGVVMGTDGKYKQNDVIATDIDEYYRSHFGIDNAEGSTFSTDFIKFREARLDYTLPTSITKKIGIQRATLGVYGRDLYIWSKWPIFDPEFGTVSGTDIVRGFEVGQFPSTRTMGVNLIVGF